MTQHQLSNRTEREVLWFQRRSFLGAAALWTSLGGALGAQAQSRSNIVTLVGDAQANGSRLQAEQTIRNGDELVTGPGANLVFVMGDSAFHLRQNSRLKVEGDSGGTVVNTLRLLTGGLVSVWGKGPQRKIVTPTLTAGIRGTGVYTEVFPAQDNRSYFCTCYGVVGLEASGERAILVCVGLGRAPEPDRVEEFGRDYARTLDAWCQAFEANLDKVRGMGFDERFIRKWRLYFRYCQAAFEHRNIGVVQAVYVRPNRKG